MATKKTTSKQTKNEELLAATGNVKSPLVIAAAVNTDDITRIDRKAHIMKDDKDAQQEDTVLVPVAEQVVPDSVVASLDPALLPTQSGSSHASAGDSVAPAQKEEDDSNHKAGFYWWLGAGVAALGAGIGVAVANNGGSGSGNSFNGNSVVMNGTVTDGPVVGSKIYVDVNADGKYDAGDKALTHNGQQIVTDAHGHFQLTVSDLVENKIALADVKLVSHGGIDTVTGESVTVDFTAPAGYLYLNPVTSVIAAYMESHPALTAAQAEAAVETALGLPDLDYAHVDLSDPAVAVKAQQAAAILATAAIIMEQTGNHDAFQYVADHLGSGGSVAALVETVGSNPDVTATAVTQLGETVAAVTAAINLDGIGAALNNTFFVDLKVTNNDLIVANHALDVGETLTGELGLGNTTDATVSYHWQSSSDGTGWTDISGATGKTYQLTAAESGAHIRVAATYTNPAGTSETVFSADQGIVAIDRTAPASVGSLAVAGAGAGNATNDATPSVSGTAEPGSTVTLYDTDGVTVLGSSSADAHGAWNITSTALDSGTHVLTVAVADLSGNINPAAGAIHVTIDTTIPAHVGNLVVVGAGTGNTTTDTTPTITGTAEPGSSVTVYDTDGVTVIGVSSADPATGAWSVTSSVLDNGAHTLVVAVTDPAGNTNANAGNLAVIINNAPVLGDYTVNLAENSAHGAVVQTVAATDADNNTLSYRIIAGNSGDAFAINSSTGIITVADATKLDYENTASFTLTVQVSDGLATDTGTVTVNLTDVNEFKAAFAATPDSNPAANSVAENAAIGTLVGITAAAADADGSNHGITYSLAAGVNSNNLFSINASTGVVTVNGALDYETATSHTITVTATSADGSTATHDFTIGVTDVNEFNAAFATTPDSNPAANSVAENAAIGTVIGITAAAADADGSNNGITYSLAAGVNSNNLFSINATTGVVTVNGALDYETATSHTITVTATSADGSTASHDFTIGVTDVNEFNAAFAATPDSNPAANSVAENAAIGTVVGITAAAADADGSNHGITYSLANGVNSNNLFSINASTGVVTVNGALDYETATSHTITVTATSADGSSATHDFTIGVTDVNEFNAAFAATPDSNPAANSVAENAAIGTVVGITAAAADADGSNHGITYSLAAGVNSNNLFSINATTGVVTVNGALDYETATSHTITVTATSADGSTATHDFTIGVTDVIENIAPSITSGATGSVTENTAPGMLVYTAVATDADAGDTRSYSLSGADAALFTINSTTGAVTLNASANYEAQSSYDITVVATDAGGLSDSKAVTISVTNVNEAPVITSGSTGSVAENAATGTVVYTAVATDVDAGDSRSYSLSGADAALFTINNTTGAVTLNASANYEAKNSYDINVIATDAGGLSDSKAVTISVTNVNEAPVITSGSTGSVAENAAPGTVVYTAAATDVDAGDSHSYSLSGADAALFNINNTTGAVTLNASANYEAKNSYDINVVATDAGGLSDSKAVTISVTNVNEAPVLTSGSTGSVAENAAPSTVVYTAAATDVDAGDSRSYSLSGTDAALFNINNTTGAVTLIASANYEAKTSYDITVVATDAGGLSDSKAVTISVTNVNEAPVITSGSTGSVAENAAPGTVVYTAAATDVDAGDSHSYSLSGADAALFNINNTTGAVTLNASANYEAKNSYDINVVATDAGGLSDSKAVTISVTNVNEAPVLTSGSTGSVAENAATSTVVYTAVATDVDAGDSRSYSLSGADAALFTINNTTGAVTLNASANYEAKNSYDINVIATDAGGLSDSKAVTISVTNVNEAPVITSAATGSVAENAATSTVVYTAVATDVDAGDSRSYSLSGTDAALLSINSSTGAVTLNASANYEAKTSYDITVVATDAGGLSDSKAVTVSVTDLNDNTPVITSGSSGNVNENAPVSTVIYTAHATDADGTAANNTVSYSLKANNSDDAGLVHIDATTGAVTLDASANYESAKTSYNFTVIASDGTNQSEQAVTVNVNDVNEAPVAVADALTANMNMDVTYAAADLLGNDTDVDAGSTLSIASVTNGTHGTVALNGDGTVTFTPEAGFTGTADFTYIATDGNLSSNSAVVTIDVMNPFYHDPGVPADAYRAVATDSPVPDITVISSISTDVVLDITPDAGPVVTLNNSTITVQATADFSSAHLDIQDATGTISVLDVTTSGVSADAAVTIVSAGSLAISEINVDASANQNVSNAGASAGVSISGDVTLGDFITVTASGAGAAASFSADGGSAVFTDNPAGGITVTASAVSGDASFTASNASGIISGITMEANGPISVATLHIDANSSLSVGDIAASATEVWGSVSLDVTGATLNNLDISLTASAYDSYVSVDIINADGTVGAISVSAGAASADAILFVSVEPVATLAIDSISLVAGGNATGSNDVANAVATIAGSGAVNIGSAIDVSASGVAANAELTLSADVVAFTATDITVTAGGDNAHANFDAENASGIISGIAVNATAASADAAASITAASADVLSLGDVSVAASGSNASADIHLYGVSFEGVDISVTAGGDNAHAHANLGEVYGPIGVDDIASVTVTASGANADANISISTDTSRAFEIGDIRVTASGDLSSAHTTVVGSSNVGSTVEVVASGASADAGLTTSYHGIEFQNTTVTVEASGSRSNASLDMPTVNGDIASITVTAGNPAVSGDVNANAVANLSAAGTLTITDSLTVSAGASADASLNLHAEVGHEKYKISWDSSSSALHAGETYTLHVMNADYSYTMTQNSNEAELINGLQDAIVASGNNPGFHLENNNSSYDAVFNLVWDDHRSHSMDMQLSNDATTFGDSHGSISITSHDVINWGQSSDIHFDSATITVHANGTDAHSSLDIGYATGTVTTLSVTADGAHASSTANVSGDITITDALHISASNGGSAYVGMGANDSYDIGPVFDSATITVSAGNSGDTTLRAYGVSGSISDFTVEATGVSAAAGANIDVNGTLTVTDHISVSAAGTAASASMGISAGVSHDIYEVHWGDWFDQGTTYTLHVKGEDYSYTMNSSDETVLIDGLQAAIVASGNNPGFHLVNNDTNNDAGFYIVWDDHSSHTAEMLNQSTDTTFSDGTNTITISAGNLVEHAVSNTLDLVGAAISVAADGDEAKSFFDIGYATGTVTTLLVTADGSGASAEANISGDITITDALIISGSNGGSADVKLGAYDSSDIGPVFDSASVTVSAGSLGDATLEAASISGTITALTAEATGFSSEASVSINTHALLAIDSLKVEASGYSSDASARISGDVTLGDFITVTASGFSADADFKATGSSAEIFSVTLTDNVAGGVTVTASGDHSTANMQVDNATGVVSALTVSASGVASEAHVSFGQISQDVYTTGSLAVGNISLSASGASDDVSVFMSGYQGRHAEATLTLPVDGGLNLTPGVYTLHIGGIDVSYNLQADGSTTVEDLFRGLQDRLNLLYPNHAAGIELEEYDYYYGTMTVSWSDYTDHAGNTVSITTPDVGVVNSVVTQTALAQSYIEFDHNTITLDGTGTSNGISLDVNNAHGTIDTINVTSSGAGNYNSAALDGTFTVHDITASATAGSAEVWLGYSQEGVVTLDDSTITVVAGSAVDGPSPDALLFASNVSGSIAELTVSTVDNHGLIKADINGNFTLNDATLDVHAVGISADVDVSLYGSNSSPELDLPGNNVALVGSGSGVAIDVAASGSHSAVSLDLLDATGTITTLTVTASGLSADAVASIDFSGHYSGSAITVSASGDQSDADAFMTAGRPTLAGISWNNYDTGGTAFAAGQLFTLTVGSVVLSYTLQAGDIVLNDDLATMTNLVNGLKGDTDYATAGFLLMHPDNSDGWGGLRTFDIVWDSAAVVHRDEITLTLLDGADLNYLNYEGFDVNFNRDASEYHHYEWNDHNGTAIVLDTAADVTLTADGVESAAYIKLDNLSGAVDTFTVSATGGRLAGNTTGYEYDAPGAYANGQLRIDGSIAAVALEAGHVEDGASAAISQTVQGGAVSVSGDGRTTLVIGDQTVDSINLTNLHDNAWGVFDLNLMMADQNYDNSAVALTDNMITITAFDATRDLINLKTSWENDQTTTQWGTPAGAYSIHYAEDLTPAVDMAAFLTAANSALNLNNDGNPDYYFGVIGSDGYLAYDKSGDGITGIIKLEGATTFSQANLTDTNSYFNYGNVHGALTLNEDTGYHNLMYGTTWPTQNADTAALTVEATALINQLNVNSDPFIHPDAVVDFSLSESGAGEIIFRQAYVHVNALAVENDFYQASGPSGSDATLHVDGASGTISHLLVDAQGIGVAAEDANSTAHFTNFAGAVHEIEIKADSTASAAVAIDHVSESVQNVWMTANSGDVQADITLDSGFVVRTDVHMFANVSNDISHADFAVTQHTHGGDLYASSTVQGDAVNGTAVFDLSYGDATAENIYLGHMNSSDLFVTGNFEGTFHLTVSGVDADHVDFTDTGTLQTNMLHIAGWDSAAALDVNNVQADDTINFLGNVGQIEYDTVVEDTIAAFLTKADGVLDGSIDYYFGVVDGNGYLAFDPDGVGITQVVEFNGMADNLDFTRIHDASVV